MRALRAGDLLDPHGRRRRRHVRALPGRVLLVRLRLDELPELRGGLPRVRRGEHQLPHLPPRHLRPLGRRHALPGVPRRLHDRAAGRHERGRVQRVGGAQRRGAVPPEEGGLRMRIERRRRIGEEDLFFFRARAFGEERGLLDELRLSTTMIRQVVPAPLPPSPPPVPSCYPSLSSPAAQGAREGKESEGKGAAGLVAALILPRPPRGNERRQPRGRIDPRDEQQQQTQTDPPENRQTPLIHHLPPSLPQQHQKTTARGPVHSFFPHPCRGARALCRGVGAGGVAAAPRPCLHPSLSPPTPSLPPFPACVRGSEGAGLHHQDLLKFREKKPKLVSFFPLVQNERMASDAVRVGNGAPRLCPPPPALMSLREKRPALP